MNNYWKNKLSDEEQNIYDKLLFAIRNRQSFVNIPKINEQKLMKCFWSVEDDHPELFYVLSRIGYGNGLLNTRVQLDYLYSASTTKQINDEIDKIVNDIKNKRISDDFQLEKAIIDTIIPDTKYQIDNANNQNAASALYYKKAQCSGFARGFKLLADRVGLWSICVRGNYVDPNTHSLIAHEWNIVRINNEYYHLDLTYLLSNYLNNGNLDGQVINSSDEQLALNTFWNIEETPKCDNVLFLVDNTYEKLSKNNVFTRLYDFKQLILNSSKSNKKTIIFQLKITQYSTEQLQKIVVEEIKKQFINVSASLKICGNIYVIRIVN